VYFISYFGTRNVAMFQHWWVLNSYCYNADQGIQNGTVHSVVTQAKIRANHLNIFII